MDATIHYTGRPDENVTTEIVGGTWTLCSLPVTDAAGKPILPLRCVPDSDVSLTGTWRGGTVKWDSGAGYALVGPPGVPPFIRVYAGTADVKATLGITGGTANGVSVKGGSGKFEGKIDHGPMIGGDPATVSGEVTLKF